MPLLELKIPLKVWERRGLMGGRHAQVIAVDNSIWDQMLIPPLPPEILVSYLKSYQKTENVQLGSVIVAASRSICSRSILATHVLKNKMKSAGIRGTRH